MSFDPTKGLVIRLADPTESEPNRMSEYWTSTRNDGYYVMRNDTELASFAGYMTTVRQLRIGDVVVKATSSGGWKWILIEDEE